MQLGADRKGRVYKTKIKEFYEEIDKALRNLDTDNEQKFNNFVALVESIVAFHKFHGED
jgi:CRISPR type III-A-associated protein Csm2